MRTVTPSQNPFSTIVLCPPTYVDTRIHNNSWMDEKVSGNLIIDREKFMGEWYNLYNILSANALVYLIPPRKKYQDQTYVNSFVCLADGKNIILSNFKGKGRAGEEIEAEILLSSLGYNIHKSPFYFEGFPECKFSGQKDKEGRDIYYGGYGQRSNIKTYDWMEEKFNIKVIKLKEKDPFLYHLDCSVFVLNKDNLMICTKVFNKKEIKEIEKITNICDVSIDAAYSGICNSIKLSGIVVNGSSIDYMKETDKYYDLEEKKNDELEKICYEVGLELVYVSLSEACKSGALASCFTAPLNYKDLLY